MVAMLPDFKGDSVSHREVADLASVRREGRDTLHLLVMDLHKALNEVSAATAVETIDGAHVHALNDSDRARVQRLSGRAQPHGRLGLRPSRPRHDRRQRGDRLTIQNDIGETDAHVLVDPRRGLTVTTTYTDVHRGRAKFFMSLFDGQNRWSPLAEKRHSALAEGEIFYLLTGRLRRATRRISTASSTSSARASSS